MKTFEVILTVSILDDISYDNLGQLKDMQSEIKSGKFQRDILKDGYKNGIRKVKATFNQLK